MKNGNDSGSEDDHSETIIHLTKHLSNKDIPFSPYSTANYNNEQLPTFWPEEQQVYILDLQCQNAEAILKTANRTNLLGYPKRWILLHGGSSSNFNFINYNVYLNSRIYVFSSSNNSYSIKSPYNLGLKTEYNDIGFWTGGRFSMLNELFDAKNRSDLKGLSISAGFAHVFESTLDHLTDFRELEKDAYVKHNYIMFRLLIEMWNLNVTIRRYRDWGSPQPNSTIRTGLIGDLQLGIIEITGSIAFITQERVPIVDYVGFTTPLRGIFVFKAPPLSVVANVLTLPFNTKVWYACCLTVILIFFVLYTIVRWEWSGSFKENVVDKKDALRPTALDIIQSEVGAVLQQGAEGEPTSFAGRIAFFVILLSLLFLFTSYCANIIALLQSTSDNIRSLEDMLTSKIKFGIRNLSVFKYLMELDHGPIQNEIIRRFGPLDEPKTYTSLEDGVEQVRNDFFAFYADSDGIYKEVNRVFLEHEKCGLKEMPFLNGIVDPYVICRKNSTYKELLRIGYAAMYERGLMIRNHRRVYTTKPKCSGDGSNFTSVSLNDLYFAVVCFFVGYGAAFLLLFFEILTFKLKSRSSKNKATELRRSW